MHNLIKQLLLVITLCISGCAVTSIPPYVQDNVFISPRVPKLMIKVDKELRYQARNDQGGSASDAYGSLASTGIKTETYIFSDYRGQKGLVINIERFSGGGGKWEMMAPDYSMLPGSKTTGKKEMNGRSYATGINVAHREFGQYIEKYFGRVAGAGNDIRFQILYFEKLGKSYPTNEFIENFSSRADHKFTILTYDETIVRKTNRPREDNDYILKNADKTDGFPCLDSLGCAKGYFCTNGKCRKGFTN